jgi:protein-tyrosine-phosphatase
MTSERPDPTADPANGPTTFNLLFVCSGNTCRSPMAAAIAHRLLAERGWAHVRVDSAGTSAITGAPASENAIRVAAEHGLDLSLHRSQPLTPDRLDWADVILAMAPHHLARIAGLGATLRASLVTDFLDGPGAGTPVADPFGGDLEEYRHTFDQLSDAVTAVVQRLERILAP